ncbi:hypothetical protein K7G98_28175, partial [Saccharothrix sp. MB29]|nr:hypothetical protein [Saccharothrix sp. MB29]
PPRPPRTATRRGGHQATVTKESLRADVADAWRRCRDGQVVVLDVPARLDDALFAGHEPGGGFPGAPQAG